MSVVRILLDSNTYFRLGDNLYPLLGLKFGYIPKYQLIILVGSVREYNYQTRLQTKFEWVHDKKHIEDRKRSKIRLETQVQEVIKNNKYFILADSNDKELGCSPFDVECLATAIQLNITLVTDDGDLKTLAGEYDVTCKSTLELLKMMLDLERVTMKDIQDTVYNWDFFNDLPRNFKSDFQALFGVEPQRVT